MHRHTLLMQRIGSCAMTLTQSKPSTRRSTLLLHRSHAVNICPTATVSRRRKRWLAQDIIQVTLVHAISSGSCRQRQRFPVEGKGKNTQPNKAIMANYGCMPRAGLAGRAGVVVRKKKKTNDYPSIDDTY